MTPFKDDPKRVSALLHLYFNIAFLMGKPQDLPAGREQLQVGVTLSLIVSLFVATLLSGLGQAVLFVLVDLIGTGAFFYLGLRMINRIERFEQAFGGLCGASAVVNLAAVPIYLNRAEPGEVPSGLAIFGEFLLLVWGLSLFSHVFRHTFEVGMVTSVLVAVTYLIVFMAILGALASPPVT